MAMNRQSSPPVRQAPLRASHCSAEPACVWPVAAEGLCVHHYRMFREPEAVLGAMLGSVQGPETEAQQPTLSAAISAALRAPQFVERNAPPAVERPQNGGTVRHCRNPSCGTRLGSNNRSGLCKRCGDCVSDVVTACAHSMCGAPATAPPGGSRSSSIWLPGEACECRTIFASSEKRRVLVSGRVASPPPAPGSRSAPPRNRTKHDHVPIARLDSHLPGGSRHRHPGPHHSLVGHARQNPVCANRWPADVAAGLSARADFARRQPRRYTGTTAKVSVPENVACP